MLAGVYQHPSTDPQANVNELELNFDYNATEIQWMVMAPGLINWVTRHPPGPAAQLRRDGHRRHLHARQRVEHRGARQRLLRRRLAAHAPADVVTSAKWSNPARTTRAPGQPASRRRRSAWTSCSTTAAPSSTKTASWPCRDRPYAGPAATGPDPVLAQFQATDPNTGQPYSSDFGWISHTYDTPYLDVGCATQDYIEAELNENTTDVEAAPGAALPGAAASGVAGTGGLGLPSQSIQPGSIDVTNPYGTYNPQVFVPGNHSGFADLVPGTPATVDPPDLDEVTGRRRQRNDGGRHLRVRGDRPVQRGGPASPDQSQAYVTDGAAG